MKVSLVLTAGLAISTLSAIPCARNTLLYRDTVSLQHCPGSFGCVYLAPCIAMTHSIVGLGTRALASAVLLFILSLISLDLGPVCRGSPRT